MQKTFSNLPIDLQQKDSAESTIDYFENYGKLELQFKASESDAVISFFKGRGMDDNAAKSVGFIFLKQCKLDDVNPFELITQLKKLEGQGNALDNVIGEVLNISRIKTSTLGSNKNVNEFNPEKRNIVA